LGGFLETFDYSIPILVVEAVNVVLEGIRNETVLDPNPGFALVVEPVLTQRKVQERIVASIVTELDVAADIPGEPMWINVAGGETSGCVAGVDEQKICMAGGM
jgi:hypothetical protein